MKYEKPEFKKVSFTCPHCHTLAQMEFDTHYFSSDFNGHGLDNDLSIARCNVCGKKIIWIDKEYIYPDVQPFEPNEDMPESVLKLYKEAGLIYNKSPRAACALLRLAVDRLCTELGQEENLDINKKIANLVSEGLSPQLQQALDLVRVVGNKAVHPGQIAFDVDNIETVHILFKTINLIVQRLITERKELEDLYNNLPVSAIKAIERRDNK